MIKRIVIKNGKKYVVNTAGWNDDVGPGVPAGTLGMQSITDGLWYVVTLTGTSGSVAISINQTPLTWVPASTGQDTGYQLLFNNTDSSVYQVYLSGSAGTVEVKVNQTAWYNPLDYKPFLSLKSTDGLFYNVPMSGSPTVGVYVDQNSKWNPVQPGISPFVTGSQNIPYSLYY